jgi:lipopolysaccharide/colanic/teichoic acid biosynthesis glycosyltransferase
MKPAAPVINVVILFLVGWSCGPLRRDRQASQPRPIGASSARISLDFQPVFGLNPPASNGREGLHASVDVAKFASARPTLWNRIRLQLGGGLLVAVLVPWAVRVQIDAEQLQLESLQQSLVGTTIALILGIYGFRRMASYPGVRASHNIFPSFAISYGLVLAAFFFTRFDYSRLQFLASFALCLAWYYVVYFKLQRQKRFMIGVVPAGAVDQVYDIPGVDWISLSTVPDIAPYDAIVADLRADLTDDWERFLADRALEGTLVMHVKQVEESLTGRVAIEHLSENNFGSLIPGIVYGRVKRLGDVVATLLLLPVLVPVLLVIGLLVRIDSAGPSLFRQQRMGYRGRVFTMYKFRTMRVQDAPEDPKLAAMTQDGDSRVTRIGRFLRRYRLDELPQAINILKGEMSWIGPRPEAVPLSRWYESELPFYRYRHIVRPGITGWAQVKQGHVAEVDEVLSKLHFDFYYIKNFSFWLDLLIVAGTIRTVLNGFGAR